MVDSPEQRNAQAAWDRIIGLGGHGVWEAETVIVSLADTTIRDEDLTLFNDFPFVQILDLSRTGIGDAGLALLSGLQSLEHLIVIDTKITEPALQAYRREHPTVK